MGIAGRIKQIASERLREAKKGMEYEKEYQAYKHPDRSFILTGKTTTDYERSSEFAERLKNEKKQAARRATQRTPGTVAIGNFEIGRAQQPKAKNQKAHSSKPQARPTIVSPFAAPHIAPGFAPASPFVKRK